MKKFLLLILTFSIFSLNGFAQNNIQLNIHHKLSDTDFEMNNAAKNNLDNDFKVTRLQYYISEISIVHGDYGEAKTAIENFRDYVAKLSNTEMHRDQFTRTFGSDEITSFKMSLAMEQFMMSIVSSDSKYDKYLAGDVQLTDSEERGRVLFEAEYNPFFPDQSGADCAHCHGGANFENDEYRNNGLDAEADITDIGREEVTQDPNDRAKNSKSLHLEISK